MQVFAAPYGGNPRKACRFDRSYNRRSWIERSGKQPE